MDYLDFLHSLDNEMKNKLRKLESIRLKIINAEWSHTFNEVCLKENLIPNILTQIIEIGISINRTIGISKF